MENSDLRTYVEQQFERWEAWRRHLHENPELSFEEEQTAAYIAEELNNSGLSHVKTGIAGHGIAVDILAHNQDAEWVLLRADMDALPIQEKNNVPYKSKRSCMLVDTMCIRP